MPSRPPRALRDTFSWYNSRYFIFTSNHFFSWQKNWVFATTSNFLITIYLKPIVNDYPSLTIDNDDPLSTIVNIFITAFFFFKNDSFFKQSYKNQSMIFFIKTILFKTIVIRFLNVQNEWVVFINDRFLYTTCIDIVR